MGAVTFLTTFEATAVPVTLADRRETFGVTLAQHSPHHMC